MARFHQLSVTDVTKTIRDAVVVTLKPVNGGDFDFTQGQYLTFRQDFDGTEVRRSYSICAGKDDGVLQVGIKKVDGGAFSTWANDALAPGMTLEAMEPMGSFHTPITPEAAKNYLGFAGGSGITPVLSIMKTVLTREPHSTFTLVYANRGVNSIMFRENLEDLKNLYMGRSSMCWRATRRISTCSQAVWMPTSARPCSNTGSTSKVSIPRSFAGRNR